MTKTFRRIVISVIIFYALLVAFEYCISGFNEVGGDLLDNYITVDVYRSDGEHEQYNNNRFNTVNRGDTVIAHIKIPERLKTDNPEICLRIYNSVFQLNFGAEKIYSYGRELEMIDNQIGTIYKSIPIPDAAFSNELVLSCYVREDNAFSRIDNVMLISADNTIKWYLGGKVAEFMLFFSLMVISVLVFFILLFSNLKKRHIRMGLWLSLFSAVLACFILSRHGMQNIFLDNERVVANLEYLTSFVLPAPLLAYYAEFVHERWLKKALAITAGVYFAFAVVCLFLNYLTADFHYCRMVPYLFVGILVGLVLIIAVSIYEKKHAYDSKVVAANGVIIFSIILLFETIRKIIVSNNIIHGGIIEISLLPIGIVLLDTMLILQCTSNVFHIYERKREEEELETLAYRDSLTGLMNRTACQKYFDELMREKKSDYSLIFLDLNNLKTANDKFGHRAGDVYLKIAAKLFNEYFRTAGLCGRFGGDEFLVIYKGKNKIYLSSMIERINQDFDNIRKTEKIGYTMSVSAGMAVSTKHHPLTIEEAIDIADKKMYENKNQSELELR